MSGARLQPGPLNTFPNWKEIGRHVKRGERGLILCMPITCNRRNEETANNDESDGEGTFTSFVYKARWFVLSQTEGEELEPQVTPEWDAKRALATLAIDLIPFDSTDGNWQGFARKRQIALNSVAQLPHKTLFHELAHVVIGHTAEADFADTEKTPRNLREVEAEAVALLCCESLGLEGADYCRGYLQNWLYQAIGFDASAISERSAQRIFRAAVQILRAGHQNAKAELEQRLL